MPQIQQFVASPTTTTHPHHTGHGRYRLTRLRNLAYGAFDAAPASELAGKSSVPLEEQAAPRATTAIAPPTTENLRMRSVYLDTARGAS